MFYKSELNFIIKTFKKYQLNAVCVNPDSDIKKAFYSAFFESINMADTYFEHLKGIFNNFNENTIYRFCDTFGLNYIFLILPKTTEKTIFCIGPYLKKAFSQAEILKKAEQYNFSPSLTPTIINYFSSIPIINENSNHFAILDSFAELIWGENENFTVVDLSDAFFDTPVVNINPNETDPSELSLNIQIMENRYNFENQLIYAVSKGQIHKAEALLSPIKNFSFKKRLSDPLRELKNYSIVMNTLLRKAAENGGVHPIYLDSISSDFAIKIEQISSISSVEKLMTEMFHSYCKLVKNHSTNNYSPIIQKVVTLIDSNLTANLNLNSLAKTLNINASYLSTRFKQETGETITDFVNKKRIKQAKHLLKTTNLQIQTIAQYCGIFDLHYFSKLFKKYVGKTASEYRDSINL